MRIKPFFCMFIVMPLVLFVAVSSAPCASGEDVTVTKEGDRTRIVVKTESEPAPPANSNFLNSAAKGLDSLAFGATKASADVMGKSSDAASGGMSKIGRGILGVFSGIFGGKTDNKAGG